RLRRVSTATMRTSRSRPQPGGSALGLGTHFDCAAASAAPLREVAKSAGESGDPSLRAPQNQGVDVVGAFIGVDRLEVHYMADHVICVGDAVAAVYVARGAGDVERLAAIVALQDRDHLRVVAAHVFEPPEPQAGMQTESDLGLHVDELFLDQLIGGE